MGETSEFATLDTERRRGGAEVPTAGVAAASSGPGRDSPMFTIVKPFVLPTLIVAIGNPETGAELAVVDGAVLDEDTDSAVTEGAEREAAVGGAATLAVVDLVEVGGAPGTSGGERDCWPAE